ncbi:type IV pilus modification protein PilV [Lysobacter sp. Root604]|uniref:type IV pilus modification protein PilV n=1 Tax=Lysobacter sp. Root604 TaxID=1736568 RepID=UPI0006F2394B|nr:type IV pilus modification protein PilV [Lysobacter sp. Root604]KRA15297.1 hypothetical protein ASD69_17630 [Lysobacter sp. Root604]
MNTLCTLGARKRSAGFSLIEVLISLLVLGFGLLGLAMLQVTNLRLTQSANTRTVATNLSYELMDSIRSNRFNAINYAGTIKAADADKRGCTAAGATGSKEQKKEFACRLLYALGEDATAQVTINVVNRISRVTVTLDWGDAKRWRSDDSGTRFSVSSDL